MRPKRVSTTLLTLALLAAVPALAGDATRWLNVHVTDTEEGANVELHLPFGLVMAVLDGVNVENFHRGKIQLELDDDADIDWPQLMKALKDSPDGDYVTVTSNDADVKVQKAAGMLRIHVTQKEDEQAVVDVTLPATLIDALAFDEHNEIDVKTLLAGLDELPDGEIVRVTSNEANVRIWIE
jgi:hypothetical protein